MASEDQPSKGLTAPYPAFQTLKTLIKPFKEHGPPNRIDRSVLTSFSGQVGSQVLTMLRFLGLIDGEDRPTAALHTLVKAYDTDEWPKALTNVLRPAYAPLFTLRLDTASPSEFNEHFRKTYPASEEVSRKSKTFFLNAAKDAGYVISPYILKGKKPRTAPTKKRTIKSAGAAKGSSHAAAVGAFHIEQPPSPQPLAKLPSETLLGLFDGDMDDMEQSAIWTLIKYFKAKGK